MAYQVSEMDMAYRQKYNYMCYINDKAAQNQTQAERDSKRNKGKLQVRGRDREETERGRKDMRREKRWWYREDRNSD